MRICRSVLHKLRRCRPASSELTLSQTGVYPPPRSLQKNGKTQDAKTTSLHQNSLNTCVDYIGTAHLITAKLTAHNLVCHILCLPVYEATCHINHLIDHALFHTYMRTQTLIVDQHIHTHGTHICIRILALILHNYTPNCTIMLNMGYI
jgi:hypothetical protein